MKKGLLVDHVQPGSIADELEIRPGDRLVAINGHPLRDIIDYHYYGAEELLLLEVEPAEGEPWEAEVEPDEGESLGLFFAPPRPMRCGNDCVFCFVHQLPRGLRAPLYVKDEDYRLSFLYGNYVTLANIRAEDLERIVEQRLSPLYVSVHATDPIVREQLLGKHGIPPILPILSDLCRAGITFHTQVVLCPGLNDGEHLRQTIEDLAGLYPRVESLAVVPVGLTRHRERLPSLQPVTAAYAREFLEEWLPVAQKIAGRLGAPFLSFGDEFFLKADVEFPPLAEYGDLPQLENGVGMVPLFLHDADQLLADVEPLPFFRATVVTGMSPYLFMSEFVRTLAEKTCVDLNLVPVRNRLFGDEVTVTGLVTGNDIVEALRGEVLGDIVFIPDVMLKEGEGVFLDDLSVEDVAAALQVPAATFLATPDGLFAALSAFTPRTTPPSS